MLLNADIIFDNLSTSMDASIDGPRASGGPRASELSLGRPELLESGCSSFRANHLYLVEASRIPTHIPAERGSVIVSIGDCEQLERYRQPCCVITLPADIELASAFNSLQRIFDDYDGWERELGHIINGTADIAALLNCSERIFGNPLYVIGDSFQMLGMSRLAVAIAGKLVEDGSLRLESYKQFADKFDLAMSVREPILFRDGSSTTLSCNLFDGDRYLGSVTTHYTQRPYRASDEPLISFLARIVEHAIGKMSASSSHDAGVLRHALQALIEERPLNGVEREVLDKANDGRRFVCAQLKPVGKREHVPLGYAREVSEQNLPHSVVFEFQRSCIVAIVFIDALGVDDYRVELRESMAKIARTLELAIGISNPHDVLYDARNLFDQADATLRANLLIASSGGAAAPAAGGTAAPAAGGAASSNGAALPSDNVFFFADNAFQTMLHNAIESTRVDLLYPEGLKRLFEHDRESPTKYAETLETYLDNNMSVTKTANALYVHRSTLLERLKRIHRILDVDFKDPEQRLLISLLLKATHYRDALGKGQR